MAENNDPIFVAEALLEKAEQALEKRLATDPENLKTLHGLAQVHRKQGRLNAAINVYEQITRLTPDDWEAAYMHAVLTRADLPAVPPNAGVRPAPFVLIQNFLPEAFHKSLLPYTLSVRDELVPAKVGKKNEYRPDHRESLDLPGPRTIKQRFRKQFVEVLGSVFSRLELPPFEVAHIEVKLRVYQDGHFFKVHQDATPSNNRKISFVYFFHRRPRPYTGGDLLLFDSDTENNRYTTRRFTRVIPAHNSLILFASPYYHTVVPVVSSSGDFADSRFVINGHVQARGRGDTGTRG